jgi:hypothetical protein
MRRIKIVGLGLVAAFALAAMTAGSASATAPEFGRCLKQATKSLSNFDSAKCVKLASEDAGTEAEKLAKGNFQWFPGVVNNKFTTKLKEATLVTIENVSGFKMICKGETSAGEYLNAKEIGKMVLKFTGCEFSGLKCNSAGKGEGEIDTAPLGGTIGFETVAENPANDTIAEEWHSESGNFAEFKCAGLSMTWRGSILHKITANTMKLTATEKWTCAKGKQQPEHFAGGVPGEHVLESNSGSGFEQAGWTMTSILTNEEAIEASTIN